MSKPKTTAKEETTPSEPKFTRHYTRAFITKATIQWPGLEPADYVGILIDFLVHKFMAPSVGRMQAEAGRPILASVLTRFLLIDPELLRSVEFAPCLEVPVLDVQCYTADRFLEWRRRVGRVVLAASGKKESQRTPRERGLFAALSRFKFRDSDSSLKKIRKAAAGLPWTQDLSPEQILLELDEIQKERKVPARILFRDKDGQLAYDRWGVRRLLKSRRAKDRLAKLSEGSLDTKSLDSLATEPGKGDPDDSDPKTLDHQRAAFEKALQIEEDREALAALLEWQEKRDTETAEDVARRCGLPVDRIWRCKERIARRTLRLK